MFIEVGLQGYHMILEEKYGTVLVNKIKEKKQKEYRSIYSLDNEIKGIEEKKEYRFLREYRRHQKTVEERYKEEKKILGELGINKEDVIEAYRNGLIEYYKKKEFS